MNIVTGPILEKDEEDFLMNYISLRKTARKKFYEYVWQRKIYICWKPFLQLRKHQDKEWEKRI